MKVKEKKLDASELQNLLGWSAVEVKFAGDFKRFSDTKTSCKVYYTKSGERYKCGFNQGGFVVQDAFLFFLKYKLAKSGESRVCSGCGGTGKVYKSNYGSGLDTSCNKCGGYGIE